MADAITGDTELGSTKSDLIAAVVQRELIEDMKLLRTITDVSQFAVKGAQSISFPKLTSFTPVNRASGVAGDATVLTSSVDKLDLDDKPYVAWIIDSNDEMQTTIAAQMEFAKRAASGQGLYVDDAIVTLLEAISPATTTASALPTRDVILEMRTALCDRKAKRDQLVFVVGCAGEEAMLKIDEFTRADIYGSSNIPSGVIGRVYGMEVIVSNNLDVDEYYMYEKAAAAIGFQKGISSDVQPANEFGVGAERHAMDQLFGVKGMQLGEQGVGAAESALAIKDNNA